MVFQFLGSPNQIAEFIISYVWVTSVRVDELLVFIQSQTVLPLMSHSMVLVGAAILCQHLSQIVNKLWPLQPLKGYPSAPGNR